MSVIFSNINMERVKKSSQTILVRACGLRDTATAIIAALRLAFITKRFGKRATFKLVFYPGRALED